MECPRCHGLMVIDQCLNLEGMTDTVWVHEWRCLNCGELFDPQTLANRKAPPPRFSSPHPQEVS
jgi:hypothetical protein